MRTMAAFRIFDVTVNNRQAIPRRGAAILASNHISYADAPFSWAASRRVVVAIAMAELWRVPGLGPVMWLLGHIPIKRGNKRSAKRMLARATRVLEHGGVVLIYPEGKCSPTGKLAETLKPGVAQLAFATGAPIVPVGIIGSNKVVPLGSLRVHRKEPVTLNFGEPINPCAQRYLGPEDEAQERLLADLREAILALSTPEPAAA